MGNIIWNIKRAGCVWLYCFSCCFRISNTRFFLLIRAYLQLLLCHLTGSVRTHSTLPPFLPSGLFAVIVLGLITRLHILFTCHLMGIWVVSLVGYYEQFCQEQSCASLSVDLVFSFLLSSYLRVEFCQDLWWISV